MKPYLVGEPSTHSDDPEFALYPSPRGSSGQRLCKALDLDPREYLSTFERRAIDSEAQAHAVLVEANGAPLILLGRKTAEAFGLGEVPFFEPVPLVGPYPSVALVLPLPSGKCLEWNDPKAKARTKELVGLLIGMGGPL